MKKIVGLFCVFLASLSVLSASDSPAASISLMIDSDFSGNYDSIAKESVQLSDFERMSLYAMHEDSPTLPFVINLLVGYGIGSFIQGDAKSGYTALVADIIGIGLYSVGYVQVYTASLDGVIPDEGITLALLGAGLLLGSRIYQCIKPFSYAKEYNRRLHTSLLGKADLSVSPVITVANNQMALGMVGRVSF